MLLRGFKERLARTLSAARYEHSLNVMEAAGKLALRWGADAEKARVAGLLHDVARDLPSEEMLRESVLAGIDSSGAPVLLHAPLGAHLLRRDWGIEDGEILQAVAEHT
ncbi:MAG: bis(5'-nucleosyl)-tetraphosphatase (symmetrical) YqeK, partial [Clostridiales bacterium]|nr:bis(5'-nucleosyl)-tetraphosphatase (symmetrical) YqeK [Clostridiales bacterium]